jgi:hypothetical protein
MIAIAIGILWLCIGVIILGGIIFIALRVVRTFWGNMDARVDQAVWAIFGILILIYVLEAVVGGGGLPHPQLFR